MEINCGFSITAQEKGSRHAGLFISGLSWEAGKFRQLIPLRSGDFVPVWGTEALAVMEKFMASAAGDRFIFEAGNTRSSIESGGPMKRNDGHFRWVDAFTVPQRVAEIDPVTGRQFY